MKSYIRLNKTILQEAEMLWCTKSLAFKRAQFVHWRSRLGLKHIQNCYGISWEGLKLLEVGCGQQLPYTLSFAQRNRVTGIDNELPLRRPYIRSFFELLKYSGVYRTSKSVIAEIAGKQRHFKQALSEITGFRGYYNLQLFRMNACQMRFPSNHFDGVFSFSVFEHIRYPHDALLEVRRVLKPEGVFYLDLHLYTSIYGDHDPRAGEDVSATVPPWKHIRPSTASLRIKVCYLNKIRLSEWRAMLRDVFHSVHFVTINGEADRNQRHLTEDIRKELTDYTEEELLTTTFIAAASKS